MRVCIVNLQLQMRAPHNQYEDRTISVAIEVVQIRYSRLYKQVLLRFKYYSYDDQLFIYDSLFLRKT